MKTKENKPQFFAYYKDPNNGKLRQIDVLEYVFEDILKKNGKLNKKRFILYDDKDLTFKQITNKNQFGEFLTNTLRWQFWGRCEWEFLAIDWPNRDTIELSRPQKIDVFEQIKPNINIIIDLVWSYIEQLIN